MLPATTPTPSLSALRSAQKTAARVRHAAPAGLGGMHKVPDTGPAHLVPDFLPARTPDPIADGAIAGARLDGQARLTCGKLLKVLGWNPARRLPPTSASPAAWSWSAASSTTAETSTAPLAPASAASPRSATPRHRRLLGARRRWPSPPRTS